MTAAAPARPSAPARVAVAVAFLLLFLQPTLVAVSNLVGLVGFAALLGRQLNAVVWVLLIVGLVLPIAGFAVGVLLGHRRSPGVFAVVLAVAFCATEALALSELALFQSVIGVL